jgi:DNA-binding GntR family transcriptional regulator
MVDGVIEPIIREFGVRKIKKGTLKDQISVQIKELILFNQLRPGQLIVIDKIAGELGVSHTPVREALAKLELEGLVILNSYQNPRVAEITPEDVREIYEMRMMIECWAVEKAATKMSDDQIQRIQSELKIARRDAEMKNYAAHLRVDLMLHESIMRSTENSLFWYLAQRVHERTIRIRSLVEATGSPQDVLSIIDEHDLIVDALSHHDPSASRMRMQTHLENGLVRTLTVLESFSKE